jgi:hypothetical protein
VRVWRLAEVQDWTKVLALESSEDGHFTCKAPANLRVARKMLMNDLEGNAVSFGDAARVIHNSGRSLSEHADDLEFPGEPTAGAEGR